MDSTIKAKFMKGLFIIFEALSEASGISKKIIAQVNAFKNNGVEIELSYLESNANRRYTGRVINNQIIDVFSVSWLSSRLHWRIKFGGLLKYIKANNFKFVYIRYLHLANPYFILFLKDLKLSGIKIILEVPTFPYDHEYGYQLGIMVERLCRKQFIKFIDRIVTFTNDNLIFGVPTIPISNGIDIGSIKPVSGRYDKLPDVINMVGVAALSFWHGYDRVITGMKDYYNNSKPDTIVIFNIVSDISSTETIKCKQLVERYNLEKYIIFHDKKFGQDLDAILNMADIGVGSLGRHRSGIKYIKPLKNREYCARGIPFFYSETDEDFDDMDFVLKIPADESGVNINNIVRFVKDNKFVIEKIRSYAKDNLTWDIQMRSVINFIRLN